MSSSSFIARRYLFSRKHISLISTLTYISIAGVTIGTALLIVVLSVFNGFFDVVKNTLLSNDPDIRIEANGASTFVEDEEMIRRILAVEEVEILSPYLEGKALLNKNNEQPVVVDVRGIDKTNFFELVDIEQSIRSGVFNLEVRNRKPGILVPEQIRGELLLNVNDEISLLSAASMQKALTQITVPRSYRFDVRGSYFIQQVSDNPSVFIELGAARRLFNTRNGISGIDIELNDSENANSVKAKLSEMLGPDFRISTWYDLQKPLYDVMYLEKWGAYVILMIIVIVAVLNIIGSLTMIVIQKKRDIGILITMGYTRKKIKAIFRKQGLFIGLIGCGIGGTVGFILCLLQQEFGLIKLSQAFIIDAYPVDIRFTDIAIILLGSLFLCVAASWFPSERASGIQPADAVRYE